MIHGIILKNLVTNNDTRGYFREIVRVSDDFFTEGFGQWSHSLMFDGVTKAWHYHLVQTDWWYVVTGVLRVGLYDKRSDSPTHRQTMDFLMGEHQTPQILKIPPGVVHGCQTVQGPVNLFYVTSHVYDPKDEHRMAFDDKSIPFDWMAGPPIT